MQVIEPNWISLLWFAVFATIGTVALLIVAGMFPLRASPRSGTSTMLVFGNAILLAALLTGTGLYGYAELRWSTLVVVGGLVVLFLAGAWLVAAPFALRFQHAGTPWTGATRMDMAVGGVLVVARRQHRTCRSGRRSDAGPGSACETRGAVLGKLVMNLCGECHAGENQAWSFADCRAGGGDSVLFST